MEQVAHGDDAISKTFVQKIKLYLLWKGILFAPQLIMVYFSCGWLNANVYYLFKDMVGLRTSKKDRMRFFSS